jgi:hypothetical protein
VLFAFAICILFLFFNSLSLSLKKMERSFHNVDPATIPYWSHLTQAATPMIDVTMFEWMDHSQVHGPNGYHEYFIFPPNITFVVHPWHGHHFGFVYQRAQTSFATKARYVCAKAAAEEFYRETNLPKKSEQIVDNISSKFGEIRKDQFINRALNNAVGSVNDSGMQLPLEFIANYEYNPSEHLDAKKPAKRYRVGQPPRRLELTDRPANNQPAEDLQYDGDQE